MLPTLDEVVVAYHDCRRGKRNTDGASRFECRLARNLTELHSELAAADYKVGVTSCFVVTHPRPREVWAGAFRDRIVHHVLYNRLAPAFHRSFSADSCACIPGRGTLYGTKRLEGHIRSITQNWSREAFYLKLDLSNFFVSINKLMLFRLIEPKINDDWTGWLAKKVLFHNPTLDVEIKSPPELMALVPSHKSLFNAKDGWGLPIGNLSSQFFANIYLNLLDQFVTHRIRPRGYIRYVDDFILLHESPQWLQRAQTEIESFLAERLDASINPTKTVLQPVSRGVDFVGQVVKPWRRVPRGTLVPSAMVKLAEAETSEQRRASANSYFGLLRQVSGYCARGAVAERMKTYGHPTDKNLTRVLAHKQEAQCAT